MPPETVKDCINMKLDIPNIYVVPTKRFDNKSFVNVCEFEFPAYFNFFVTRKRVKLICSKKEQEKLEIVFQETLLGPKDLSFFESEFGDNVPDGYKPDFAKELKHFAVNPFTREELTINTLLEFVNYDDQGAVYLGDDSKLTLVLTK